MVALHHYASIYMITLCSQAVKTHLLIPIVPPFLRTDGQYWPASPDVIRASHPVPVAGLAHKYFWP